MAGIIWRCESSPGRIFANIQFLGSAYQSYFGWNPRRNKIVVGREIVSVAVHKMHKKENNAFKFLQAIVFIYDVCIYKMCRIQ